MFPTSAKKETCGGQFFAFIDTYLTQTHTQIDFLLLRLNYNGTNDHKAKPLTTFISSSKPSGYVLIISIRTFVRRNNKMRFRFETFRDVMCDVSFKCMVFRLRR